MKNFIHFIAALFLSANLFAQGQIINVPDDQPTIQGAIDGAVDGDTILVYDGVYYESINYNGKALTVASWFLVDGDKTHIDSTIIDGSQTENVSIVNFKSGEDTTSVLYGFTITGGKGGPDDHGKGSIGAGGIAISRSGAKIQNNIISDIIINADKPVGGGMVIELPVNQVLILDNYITNNKLMSTGSNSLGGAGIFCYQTDPGKVLIANNIISGNDVSLSNGNLVGQGGGILLYEAHAFIRNNLIKNNKAKHGGGILYDGYPGSEKPDMVNNTIIYNEASSSGGGVEGWKVLPGPELKNSILWGNTAPDGSQISRNMVVSYSDIEGGYEGFGNMDLDPFFADTTLYYLNSLSPCVDAGSPYPTYKDLEDPDNPGFPLPPALGGLRNDMGAYGGNPDMLSNASISRIINVPDDQPTIQAAINVAVDGDTVLVEDGRYYESINYSGKAVTVASWFLVDGDKTHIDSTIIDGSQTENVSVVNFRSGEDITSVLYGFTITGGKGEPDGHGYGTFGAGGIGISSSGAKIQNNIISDLIINADKPVGGGMVIELPVNQVLILDNYITNNKLMSTGTNSLGGAGIFCYKTDPEKVLIANNVISGNDVLLSNGNLGGQGGGILLYEAHAFIRNNLIKK